MASLTYGKRMLKAVMEKNLRQKRANKSPDEEAKKWCCLDADKDGFKVKYISDFKGFGVFATKQHERGDFLLEYVGEHITPKEAEKREKNFAHNKVFLFTHNGKRQCIDASATHKHICQLVNDADSKEANSIMKLRVFNKKPKLCLFALKTVAIGDELSYDYGDDKNLWWRRKGTGNGCGVKNSNDDDDDDDPFGLGNTSDMSLMETEAKEADSAMTEAEVMEAVDLQSDSKIEVKSMETEAKETYSVMTIEGRSMETEAKETDSVMTIETDIVMTIEGKSMETGAKETDSVMSIETDSVMIIEGRSMETEAKETDSEMTIEDRSMETEAKETDSEMTIEGRSIEMEAKETDSEMTIEGRSMETEAKETDSEMKIEGRSMEMEAKETDSEMTIEGRSMETEAKETDSVMSIETDSVMTIEGRSMETEAKETDSVMSIEGGSMETEAKETDSEMTEEKDRSIETEAMEADSEMIQERDGGIAEQGKAPKCRPVRFCVFCKKIFQGGKLKRHIKTHKTSHNEVSEILRKPLNVQNKFFEQKRIEGIYEYNMTHLESENKLRQRKPKTPDALRLCTKCKKFISNRTFYKHKMYCTEGPGSSDALKVNLIKPLAVHADTDFISNILNRFRENEVGNFIRKDKLVQAVGFKHYCSRRVESSKINEVRKEIMTEMRELARLFLRFQSITNDEVETEDMFKRKHLGSLKEAISEHCEGIDVGKEKHGLKLYLNSVIQKSIKILKGYYSESMRDRDLEELNKFQDAYNYNKTELLAKARYQANSNSMQKARLPQNLPIEKQMKSLKKFIEGEIGGLLNEFNLTHYTWLRSLVVARLTLYNGRRGEEPSRILIQEWIDALEGKWVPTEKETIEDEAEKFLLGQFKLAYLHGKNKKLVPVLVPIDLIYPIQVLIDNREKFGISGENLFLFGTKSSHSHCSGWHAVNSVCEVAGVKVNATRNRHRLSCLYASQDMSRADQKVFLEHLGHAEDINKDNYQCPPGLKEIRVMGKFLNAVDGSSEDLSRTCTVSSGEHIPVSHVSEPSKSDKITSHFAPTSAKGHFALTSAKASDESDEDEKLMPVKAETSERFSWTTGQTKEVVQYFKKWVQQPRGNTLPSKIEMQDFLTKHPDWRCTNKHLRTKTMNEQRKFQRLRSLKLKELVG